MDTDELEQLYLFEDPNSRLGYFPLGVQGEHLYFHANIDNTVGNEIYRIAVDLPSNTQEISNEVSLTFAQIGTNAFRVETDIDSDFNIEVYDLNGRSITNQSVRNNSVIEISFSGMVILKANLESGIETYMKFVSQ